MCAVIDFAEALLYRPSGADAAMKSEYVIGFPEKASENRNIIKHETVNEDVNERMLIDHVHVYDYVICENSETWTIYVVCRIPRIDCIFTCAGDRSGYT